MTALAVAAAAAHLDDCRLCPHRCGAARSSGSGVCRVGRRSFVASEMLHMGEETPLCPAHAIFFSGCTATCSFCTAARFAFRPTHGVAISAEQLVARIRRRQDEGARSVCFIGGDPAPHIPLIVETLAVLGPARRIPAVLNSNFYLSQEAMALLADAIDIYLPDLKFGPGRCGDDLGGMPSYWSIVTQRIEDARQSGRRVIVRHLLMPGHFSCCTEPVLHWLARRPDLEVSLLTQYLAPAHARGPLATILDASAVHKAQTLAQALNLRLVR